MERNAAIWPRVTGLFGQKFRERQSVYAVVVVDDDGSIVWRIRSMPGAPAVENTNGVVEVDAFRSKTKSV